MSVSALVQSVNANAVALIAFEWQPFDRSAILCFRTNSDGKLAVKLNGIHFLATRQSLLGQWNFVPPSDASFEDWYVHFFDVSCDGDFLNQYLDRQLALPSRVMPYSLNGAGLDSAEFVRPIHLSVVTSGGHLDAICEVVEIVNPSNNA